LTHMSVWMLSKLCACMICLPNFFCPSTDTNGALTAPDLVFARAAAVCHFAHAAACQLPNRNLQKLETLAACASSESIDLGGKMVSPQKVAQEQAVLMKMVDSAPNVFQWMSVFIARFDVVTKGMFANQVEPIKQWACSFACNYVAQEPASRNRLPSSMALGSFTLALVAVRILSIQALWSQLFSQEQWHRVCPQLQRCLNLSDAIVSSPHLDECIAAAIFELVTMTTFAEGRKEAMTVAIRQA